MDQTNEIKEIEQKKESTILKILRDPIWQFMSVVLTFILFLTPILYIWLFPSNEANKEENAKLYIAPSSIQSFRPLADNLSNRTKLLIDGKEEKNIHLLVYYFQYKGKKSLRETDFVLPIRGTLPENRKLISVQKSEKKLRGLYTQSNRQDIRLTVLNPIDAQDTADLPEPINVADIEVVDQRNFIIKIPLLNNNDWFSIEIYSSSLPTTIKSKQGKGDDEYSDSIEGFQSLLSEVTWTCRVAETQCPSYFTNDELEKEIQNKSPYFLNYKIYHYGWSIYFIAVFNTFSLILFLILISRTKNWRPNKLRGVLLFFLLSILCLSTSEILADSLFNQNFFNQPYISFVGLSGYIIVFIILLVSFIKNILKSSIATPDNR